MTRKTTTIGEAAEGDQGRHQTTSTKDLGTTVEVKTAGATPETGEEETTTSHTPKSILRKYNKNSDLL